MSEFLRDIDDLDFKSKVLESKKPIMVDFWAPWCGPCKALGPVVEELATRYSDKMAFAKCNIDDNPQTPMNYGIKAIPTLIIFKDGKPVETITGLTGRKRLEESIEAVLGGAQTKQPFIVQ